MSAATTTFCPMCHGGKTVVVSRLFMITGLASMLQYAGTHYHNVSNAEEHAEEQPLQWFWCTFADELDIPIYGPILY